MEDEDRDWFVGVNWAEWARAQDLRSRSGWHRERSQTHHVFVIVAEGRKVGERGFTHSGEGLAELAAWIVKQTGTAPDAASVAIEVPHGPVVESLVDWGFLVHSIDHKQLDRFRNRVSPAAAKDDSPPGHLQGCCPGGVKPDRSARTRVGPTCLWVATRRWPDCQPVFWSLWQKRWQSMPALL